MRISKNDVDDFPRFARVEAGVFVADSLCFIVGKHIPKLVEILNSQYAAYYFFNNVAILDDGGMQMRQQFVEAIPLPTGLSALSDDAIFNGFGFTEKERTFIEQFIAYKKSQIAMR